MKTPNALKSILVFIIFACASHATPAVAEITNCIEITSIPTTLSSQGVYCLKDHVSAALNSGNAINITTNNVTVDCNNYKVGNLAAGPGTTAVGFAAENRMNITVRNCGIRGFMNGLELTNGSYRIEDNLIDHNTVTGAIISGDGSVIRRNEVNDTGGTTVSGINQFHGIFARGDTDIIDNTITAVMASTGSNGTAYGIRSEDMNSGTIKGNRVRNLVKHGFGVRRGIWNENGARNTVEGNTVVLSGGLLGDAGIRCGGALLLNGASRNNTVLGAGLLGVLGGLVNCTSVGGGDYVNIL